MLGVAGGIPEALGSVEGGVGMKPLWPHQTRGIESVRAAIDAGERRIALTCPTGGGKSRMMFELIQWACDTNRPVALYTNRRMLFDQLSAQLDAHYLPHGKRAASHKPALLEDVQLCMTQTELAAVYQKKRRELHPAKLVLIDECFVAGTKVLTVRGWKSIETIRPGDIVFSAVGPSCVSGTSSRLVHELYDVEISDGSRLLCTGQHPIFTERGWIPASMLVEGSITFGTQDMSRLWEGFWAETLDESSRQRVRNCGEPLAVADDLLYRVQQETQEPDGQFGDAPQGEQHDEDAWPQEPGATTARREKDGGAESTRVVRVSRIKRSSPVAVFNLHVSRHPSYFANGHLVHNCHVQVGNTVQQIIQDHEATGAATVGFTATPLDIENIYRKLIVAGTTSELRACGALVPAMHYGVDEPDLNGIKRQATGEYEYDGVKKRIMTQSIVGRVVEHWTRLNPDGRPTILFACGVAESLWFAKEFEKIGIPAAHIDGGEVYWQGELHKSNQVMRERVVRASRDGDCPIVCNRFVLREGIDWPWLYAGILATVFGSPASYIQSCGRLLRACGGKTHAIIQDHGGNWHRHGSINADREWCLEYTPHIFEGLRADRIREGAEPEPICCPKCHALRLSGRKCHSCGFEHSKRVRMVVQKDGRLVEHEGSAFPQRRVRMLPDTDRLWRQCYERARRSKNGMTFNQAVGLFVYENHHWPPRDLRFMPTEPMDWFRKVKDVPAERLTGYEEWQDRPDKQRRFA
jgi:superfamily II DNA or RNA helicase